MMSAKEAKETLEVQEKGVKYASHLLKKYDTKDAVIRSVILNTLAHAWFIGYKHAKSEKATEFDSPKLQADWFEAFEFYIKSHGGSNNPNHKLIESVFMGAYRDGIHDYLDEIKS